MLKCIDQQNSTSRTIPLKHLILDSQIRSIAADIHLTQIFDHHHSSSTHAVFHFPIPDRAVIYEVKAKIGQREILAQLNERTKSLVQIRNDGELIFDLGWIPPLATCQITIGYVVELEWITETLLRLTIPRTIVKTKENYSMEIQCAIESLPGLTHLQSASHQLIVHRSNVTFTADRAELDRDFLLDLHLNRPESTALALVERDAAMVAVIPFEENVHPSTINEFIFLIDCSSSMRTENKIEWIRQAMYFFLRNLPEKSYFNVILFGSVYRSLFNHPTVIRNAIHLKIAERLVEQIDADLGATDLTAPLFWLKRHPPAPNRLRHVILLSDGQASNPSDIFHLARSIASTTRIFSFTFGASLQPALIKGLAKITRGDYIIIPLTSTSLDRYLRYQWKKILRPSMTNLRIEWNMGVPMISRPTTMPFIYLNDRLVVYALTQGDAIPRLHRSSISIRSDHIDFQLNLSDADRASDSHSIIGRLACQALIDELEDAHLVASSTDRLKIEEEIIHRSLKYHIFNRWLLRAETAVSATTDEQIVHSIVREQNSAGLWEFPSMWKRIEALTGKSLHVFQSSAQHRSTEILLTIIIVVLLESKFSHLRSQWDLAADRARRCLIYLMENNWRTFVQLFKEIRDIIEE